MGERRELCELPEEIGERGFAGQENRESSFTPCEDSNKENRRNESQ